MNATSDHWNIFSHVDVPLLTQSDPGRENTRVANAQSLIRQSLDPELQGKVQHNWKRNKSNVKAEIEWSQLRRRWSPGFESILEEGVREGIYDTSKPIEVLVFRYLVIPWIQKELDIYRNRVNNFLPRKNKYKLTPHGRPSEDIHFRPDDYQKTRDFKILVPPDVMKLAEDTYIEDGHPVLELVPYSFQEIADVIFEGMGRPEITHENVWAIYSDMLEQVEVNIELGAITRYIVQDWGRGIVSASQESDREAVEQEEAGAAHLFCNVDAPPEGFVALEDGSSEENEGMDEGGPLQVDLTDDESDGDDNDYAWLAL
ncbi:hypothetical protein EST38_g8913 [Candolleomyces aberdarensis]|uniref:Uncharacterized protein n=1 Tax=Candolleomyces aberdarensis TaxID=2316362 RepID=A0A4Q2DB99_9AGAR|nr:hypothetical protein EST38_g8913 [Candolleomyces aberdarensis]